MGLTRSSVGKSALDRTQAEDLKHDALPCRVVCLAGNPNVGKSTIFNALTGMHQHTGNWAGKTVSNAWGYTHFGSHTYRLVDLPGTYSLLASSPEECVARDFICFSYPDAVVVICDATALERNLNLVLQIIEMHPRVVVCINLLDAANRQGLQIDLSVLRRRLGVEVVGTVGRDKKSLSALMQAIEKELHKKSDAPRAQIPYPHAIERALALPMHILEKKDLEASHARWLALKLLDRDEALLEALQAQSERLIVEDTELKEALEEAWKCLKDDGIDAEELHDLIAIASAEYAAEIAGSAMHRTVKCKQSLDRRLDKLLTGRAFGYPMMLLLLIFIFWLTIEFSNLPSQWLSGILFSFIDQIGDWLLAIEAPWALRSILTDGVLYVLAWVISVMLPPMAIFFPLFTILEDIGYLPRVAYNLDRPFALCGACGKQALTTCMGFGCNAAGVVGCRIIDSPRERLLAILTNSFVPCNGRFPALIALLGMFFVGFTSGPLTSFAAAIALCLLIVFGITATLLTTKLLSKTLLRGIPSAFLLEMPPYRMPQFGKVIVRSIFDRTLFVLGRAAAVAAPAGLVIWCMANLEIGNVSLLIRCADFLDPFAALIGMDGIILMAFILGFPANEIVIPLIVMGYLSTGTLTEMSSLSELRALLISNGWTATTAICVMVFFILHWPCSTTILTIFKETKKLKWTLIATLLPTAIGMLLCALIKSISCAFSI